MEGGDLRWGGDEGVSCGPPGRRSRVGLWGGALALGFGARRSEAAVLGRAAPRPAELVTLGRRGAGPTRSPRSEPAAPRSPPAPGPLTRPRLCLSCTWLNVGPDPGRERAEGWRGRGRSGHLSPLKWSKSG